MTKVRCNQILCKHFYEFCCQKEEIELCHEEGITGCWEYEEIKEEERV
jgi:hypothetical protein